MPPPVPISQQVSPSPSESARIDALFKEVGIVNGRVEVVQNTLGDVKSGVDELRSAVAGMVRLEVRHESAALAANELRRDLDAAVVEIGRIKEQMPGLLETRQDVRKLVWIIVSAVVLAVLGVVLAKT